MGIDRAELETGLANTRRYLLSHHEPDEYHKCWRLQAFGRHHHLCARCTGIYPGILAGLLAWWVTPGEPIDSSHSIDDIALPRLSVVVGRLLVGRVSQFASPCDM